MTDTEVWLVRHGETEWSRNGRHTGATDLPLTETGEAQAVALKALLAGASFDRVLSSPLTRARRTAELAGFEPRIVDELVEWDYGSYEGRTRVDIHEERPDWTVWLHGAPGGESPADVTARVGRVIEEHLREPGRTLVFAHGHILRALATQWIERPLELGAHLDLDTATVSVLTHDRGVPVLGRWNAP